MQNTRKVNKRWVEHLEKHEIQSERQYGFRKGKSCVTNLLSYYDRVAETMQERDGWVDSIYLKISKKLLTEFLTKD